MPNRGLLSLLMLSAAGLYGQALIEYGASAGRAGAAAGAAPVSRSVAGAFDKVSKALAGATSTGESAKVSSTASVAPTSAATPATAAPAAAVTPSPVEAPAPPPDFSALAAGMDRADLLKKVGKPSMSMSIPESSSLVETCWYRSGNDSIKVTLRDGKVTEI